MATPDWARQVGLDFLRFYDASPRAPLTDEQIWTYQDFVETLEADKRARGCSEYEIQEFLDNAYGDDMRRGIIETPYFHGYMHALLNFPEEIIRRTTHFYNQRGVIMDYYDGFVAVGNKPGDDAIREAIGKLERSLQSIGPINY